MPEVEVTYGVLNFNPQGEPNATAAFKRTVESLMSNRDPDIRSEVYIIDQGGQGQLVENMAREFGVNAITLHANVGISRGINLIANLARGQYISLVTSDVVFAPGTDVILIEELEKNPDVAQICPTSSKSSLDHQQGVGPTNAGIVRHLVQELTIQFWPRSTFERIGYFDERWKACYENLDYALRCFIGGGSVAISRRAFCHHEHNMCSKNGSIDHAYDDYIKMPGGLDHGLLLELWNAKWPVFNRDWLYSGDLSEDARSKLHTLFKHNIYLPYVQNVGY